MRWPWHKPSKEEVAEILTALREAQRQLDEVREQLNQEQRRVDGMSAELLELVREASLTRTQINATRSVLAQA